MTPLRIWWRGAGLGGWLGGAMALMAVTLFLLYRPFSDAWIAHGTQRIGEVEVSVSSRGPVRDGQPVRVRIQSSTKAKAFIGINGIEQEVELEPEKVFTLPTPVNTPPMTLVMQVGGTRAEWYLGRTIKSLIQ